MYSSPSASSPKLEMFASCVSGSSVARQSHASTTRPRASEAAHERRAVVGVEVGAVEQRQRLAAIDEAARDRAARFVVYSTTGSVSPLRSQRAARSRQCSPSMIVPAEVAPGERPRRRHVDVLPAVLADVGDVEVAGLAIERVAPRIAQPDVRRSAASAAGASTSIAASWRAARSGSARCRADRWPSRRRRARRRACRRARRPGRRRCGC